MYAMKLWEAADNRRAIDMVIADMCETIAKKSSQNLESSLVILDMIQTKKIKAETPLGYRAEDYKYATNPKVRFPIEDVVEYID